MHIVHSRKNRKDCFAALAGHPWYSRHYRRMSTEDLEICTKFIDRHSRLSANEFEAQINRMFLDVTENCRPKKWVLIQELLSAANAAFRAHE